MKFNKEKVLDKIAGGIKILDIVFLVAVAISFVSTLIFVMYRDPTSRLPISVMLGGIAFIFVTIWASDRIEARDELNKTKPSNGEFTVPEDGLYRIEATATNTDCCGGRGGMHQEPAHTITERYPSEDVDDLTKLQLAMARSAMDARMKELEEDTPEETDPTVTTADAPLVDSGAEYAYRVQAIIDELQETLSKDRSESDEVQVIPAKARLPKKGAVKRLANKLKERKTKSKANLEKELDVFFNNVSKRAKKTKKSKK